MHTKATAEAKRTAEAMHKQIITLLVANGEDINARNKSEETAVRLAT